MVALGLLCNMARLDTTRLRPVKDKLHVVSRFFNKQFINKSGYVLVCMDNRKKGVPALGFPRLALFHRWYYCYCHGLKAKDIRGDEIHHIGPKLDNRRHKLTRMSHRQHKKIEMEKRRRAHGFH